MKGIWITLAFLLCSLQTVFAGTPIDIRKLPFSDEMYLVAIDVQVNPTNMPDAMLWDLPILMVYHQVDNFENIDVDAIRADVMRRWQEGTYQPVVIRTRQNQSLTLHLMNLIGEGTAPERVVQGVVCKNCKKRAYTFGYKEGLERTHYPWLVSIHAHGIQYSIENDGTRSGMNVANNQANDGLVPPGETRTYFYEKLDLPGVWPIHDHGNPNHTVPRGLHMALVVEGEGKRVPDHDFLIIFSDYPEYQEYLDEFYGQTFIPAFLHMRNGNVMHAHALNGYAAMLPPRMNRSANMGATKWDAMRTDIIGEPRTPVFEVELGKLVRFRLLSYGGATTTHSFHIHGHAWYDRATDTYQDNIAIPGGSSYDVMFFAGGQPYRENPYFSTNTNTFTERSGTGDWLYHCHVVPHVKHGMWGIFRVKEAEETESAPAIGGQRN